MARLILLLLGAILLGCRSSAPGPVALVAPPGNAPSPGQGIPSDRIEIGLGESVQIAAGDFTIAFDAVPGDSRCPLDVRCIWEGSAAVRLVLTSESGGSRAVTLYTSQGPRKVEYQGVKIFLEDLKPYPTETGPQNSVAYRAVLRVEGP